MKFMKRVAACLVLALLMSSVYVQGASTVPYQKIEYGKNLKANGWTFCDTDAGIAYQKGDKKYNIQCNSAITNGATIYFTKTRSDYDGFNLYKVKAGKTTSTKIASLKHGEGVVGCYGKDIYFTRHDVSYGCDWTYIHTYAYNTSTKKIRRVLKNVDGEGYGRYVFGQPNTGAAGMAMELKLYNGETKKARVVTKKSMGYERIGNYVYYTKVTSGSYGKYKVKVYKFKLGSKKNTLVSKKIFKVKYLESIKKTSITYTDWNGNKRTAKYK